MPVLKPHSLEIISRSPEQTRRIGMRLGARLQTGDVICLVGDLGAGKTTLVQGISAGWGSLDNASSPTFVLVNVYRRPAGEQLYHLDAYRLAGVEEAEDLDLDTIIASGPLIIEWADRIQAALPEDGLWISLAWVDQEQRDLMVIARGARYQALLSGLQQQEYGVPGRVPFI
jgi:tRNA threonylcarbamoyladenosine biosynthesis protein TsaE